MKINFKKVLICTLLVLPLLAVQMQAGEAYENYSYTLDLTPHAEPQAYLAAGTITGQSLGIGDFNAPADVFVATDDRLYIADAGNNRIVVLTPERQLEAVVETFVAADGTTDTFSNPSGVYVTSAGDLYIADTDNYRIVVLDAAHGLKHIFTQPTATSFIGTFQPVKLSVDKYERMFVVSKGCENGLIHLEKDGSFSSYFGAIQTTMSTYDLFWRMFQTEEELSRLEKNIPTVYSNCDIDADGFVYGTVSATGEIYDSTILVRRLNPMGTDILKRDGVTEPIGDALLPIDETTGQKMNSQFVDVCTRSSDRYSVLDRVKNRIFTYDGQGNLLYVFGGYGEQLGCFVEPSGMDSSATESFFVSDAKLNHIVVFEPTQYAGLINDAVQYQQQRKYDLAQEKWQEVLTYSSKSEAAYNNLGKILLMSGDRYDEAAFYFKLGNSKELYSSAFKYQRREFLNRYFSLIMMCLLGLIAMLVVLRTILKHRAGKHVGKSGDAG